MNFINEQNVPVLEVSQQTGQIPCPLHCWTGCDSNICPHLIGNNRSHSGLPKSGWAVQQYEIQRFTTFLCSVNRMLLVFLVALLTDVISKIPRPHRYFQLILLLVILARSSIYNSLNRHYSSTPNTASSPSGICQIFSSGPRSFWNFSPSSRQSCSVSCKP